MNYPRHVVPSAKFEGPEPPPSQRPKHKFTLTSCDDWSALYVDGKVEIQGHSIHAEQVLEVLSKYGIPTDSFSVDDEWMEHQGEFPSNINDIPDSLITR